MMENLSDVEAAYRVSILILLSPSSWPRGRHRPDGPRHPRRHPPIASDSVMRMTAIHVQTERKRQDGSVRRAEKHRRRSRTVPLRGLIRPVFAACAASDAAQGVKRLSGGRIQAFFTSASMPLGECRLIKNFFMGFSFKFDSCVLLTMPYLGHGVTLEFGHCLIFKIICSCYS
jgi:hypothetical protein